MKADQVNRTSNDAFQDLRSTPADSPPSEVKKKKKKELWINTDHGRIMIRPLLCMQTTQQLH